MHQTSLLEDSSHKVEDLEALLGSMEIPAGEPQDDEQLFFDLERQLEPYSGFYHQMAIPEWEDEQAVEEEKQVVPVQWTPSEGYAALLDWVRKLY